MRLAIDVMGGDYAPDAVVRGCIQALPSLGQGDELILVGPEALIRAQLASLGARDDRLSIEHADEVIGMDESPAMAVRTKRRSSIVRMALLGSARGDRRADAVLSAGNTGACVTAALVYMKRLPGVLRPGIAVTVPAFHGPLVLCDAGANPEPRVRHLWQYALMADTYARHVLHMPSPRVALMNIGSEEAKGTGIIRSANELLRATAGLNYIGYVEGRDFFDGVADVIVTDGFVGNALLKMAEGMAQSMFKAIAQEIRELDAELAARFDPIVRQIYAKSNYEEYGGAPLLGVNGAMIIAHGSSKAHTICAAIRNCLDFVKTGVNEAIVERLASLAPAGRASQECA